VGPELYGNPCKLAILGGNDRVMYGLLCIETKINASMIVLAQSVVSLKIIEKTGPQPCMYKQILH
ncbi:MAG TPA: hypothetical protein VN038_14885, partial [Dyadobacter sp.]|nr:hypothetical protein [Dyadobacter sp.]